MALLLIIAFLEIDKNAEWEATCWQFLLGITLNYGRDFHSSAGCTVNKDGALLLQLQQMDDYIVA